MRHAATTREAGFWVPRSQGRVHTLCLIEGRRGSEFLWSNLRLVVHDIGTLWETGSSLPTDADAETNAAIAQVRSTGVPVRLRAQSRRVRYRSSGGGAARAG